MDPFCQVLEENVMKTYRLGLIGYAHAHVLGNARSFNKLEGRVTWVAASDVKPFVEPISDKPGTRPSNISRTNEELGITDDQYYGYDYLTMLDENEFDIILVNCENVFHAEVCEEILKRDIHVVLEKPLATDWADSRRIERAAQTSKAEVFLNYPSSWWSHIRKAHELVQDGVIGDVLKITYRNLDSQGPFSYGQGLTEEEMAMEWWYQRKAGGGAFYDYCCYGANVVSWFLPEEPQAAYGLKGNYQSHFGDVDDYATITVQYPNSVAIIEGSWVTKSSGVPHGPVIYGTEGTLVVTLDGKVEVYLQRHHEAPDHVYEGGTLPEGRETLGAEVINHLDTGEPVHPTLTLELNMRTMQILDAGMRSTESGKLEQVNNNVYN